MDATGGRVRLEDAADIKSLPDAVRLRATRLEIPAPRTSVSVPVASLSGRFRAQMPLLACWLPTGSDATIIIRPIRRATAPAAMPIYPAPSMTPAAVRVGDVLNLSVSVGSIRIQRQVTAMQPARPGQRLFVRSAEGRLWSVRYESAPQ
jgi:hypothetical protein